MNKLNQIFIPFLVVAVSGCGAFVNVPNVEYTAQKDVKLIPGKYAAYIQSGG